MRALPRRARFGRKVLYLINWAIKSPALWDKKFPKLLVHGAGGKKAGEKKAGEKKAGEKKAGEIKRPGKNRPVKIRPDKIFGRLI